MTAPAPDVPANVAPFAGAWSGAGLDKAGDEVMCQTLIVEDVFPNGYARIVDSRASSWLRRDLPPDLLETSRRLPRTLERLRWIPLRFRR